MLRWPRLACCGQSVLLVRGNIQPGSGRRLWYGQGIPPAILLLLHKHADVPVRARESAGLVVCARFVRAHGGASVFPVADLASSLADSRQSLQSQGWSRAAAASAMRAPRGAAPEC